MFKKEGGKGKQFYKCLIRFDETVSSPKEFISAHLSEFSLMVSTKMKRECEAEGDKKKKQPIAKYQSRRGPQ